MCIRDRAYGRQLLARPAVEQRHADDHVAGAVHPAEPSGERGGHHGEDRAPLLAQPSHQSAVEGEGVPPGPRSRVPRAAGEQGGLDVTECAAVDVQVRPELRGRQVAGVLGDGVQVGRGGPVQGGGTRLHPFVVLEDLLGEEQDAVAVGDDVVGLDDQVDRAGPLPEEGQLDHAAAAQRERAGQRPFHPGAAGGPGVRLVGQVHDADQLTVGGRGDLGRHPLEGHAVALVEGQRQGVVAAHGTGQTRAQGGDVHPSRETFVDDAVELRMGLVDGTLRPDVPLVGGQRRRRRIGHLSPRTSDVGRRTGTGAGGSPVSPRTAGPGPSPRSAPPPAPARCRGPTAASGTAGCRTRLPAGCAAPGSSASRARAP